MAATPEGESVFADPEPFSPSIFRDLPPTPRPAGDGEDPAASSDDLVLPFISRMLMEDMDDELFHLFPDHPALLQAQAPYARTRRSSLTPPRRAPPPTPAPTPAPPPPSSRRPPTTTQSSRPVPAVPRCVIEQLAATVTRRRRGAGLGLL
ncbi:hypothetical protein BS78_05G030400 [Paspalum vaginatum]|nr:hypothetical protein BS78_05G030400 [Paspalum vaginatum]